MAEEIEGLDRVNRRLAEIIGKVRHPEPALNAAGEYVIGSFKRNFLSGGRPNKWPGLAASTIASRLRGKGGKSRGARGRHKSAGGMRVLIDTTSLMSSASKKLVDGGVQVGFPDDSGPKGGKRVKRLHFGYPGGSGRGHSKTPERPFAVLQVPQDSDFIGKKIFGRYLFER